MVLEKLNKLGIKNIRYLAKGKRSIVYVGLYKNKKVAIKTEKKGIAAKFRIQNETNFLKILNKHKIGPKLIYPSKKFFIYKFIKGKFITDWIKSANKNSIKKVLKNVLKQCYVLDKLKINKKELHHPIKHILVYKNNPVMIDFERCYYTTNPKNLTQFCQFLISWEILNILKKKDIKINKNKLINLLRIYKKQQNKDNFNNILKLT